jgi:flagellar motor switch protein FliM
VQYWFQANNENLLNESRQKLKDRLNIVNVLVYAILGETSITVNDFLNLQVGDVISLDKKAIEPVKLYVGNEPCYYCKPGVIGKYTGVQVLDNIDKDVEKNESWFPFTGRD